MADRLYPMFLAAAACCALTACATQTTPEAENTATETSGQESTAPAAAEDAAVTEATPPEETPAPPQPTEGLRLPPTQVALPSDEQFRATNPGSSRLQPAPRPDPGAVIVRPPAE